MSNDPPEPVPSRGKDDPEKPLLDVLDTVADVKWLVPF
jgi:hypothetical protein